jgi:hypothetical protein
MKEVIIFIMNFICGSVIFLGFCYSLKKDAFIPYAIILDMIVITLWFIICIFVIK